jgi:hypothetical protein
MLDNEHDYDNDNEPPRDLCSPPPILTGGQRVGATPQIARLGATTWGGCPLREGERESGASWSVSLRQSHQLMQHAKALGSKLNDRRATIPD